MKVFCDMDGVLVRQTGRYDFDKMPWMTDGKTLWDFIKAMHPVILSQLPDETYDTCNQQKRDWCARELGEFDVIITRKSIGKGPYAFAGAILIDDAPHTHGVAWTKNGGTFVHHISAVNTIERLRALAA